MPSLPPLQRPELAQGADRLIDGLPDRGQAGDGTHTPLACWVVGNHRVAECACGASVELFAGVRPFCPIEQIEAEYASTLAAATAAINLAVYERARKLQWAAREQRLAERLVRKLSGRSA